MAPVSHKDALVMVLALVLALAAAMAAKAHDIGKILQLHSDFTAFGSLLQATRLADDINAKKGVTVLAVNNQEMMAKLMQRSTDIRTAVAKNVLRLHSIMDFWSWSRLPTLADQAAFSATFLEVAKGTLVPARSGFANVTREPLDGKIIIRNLAGHNDRNGFTVVLRPVYEEPYNISVLQVDRLMMPSIVTEATAPAHWQLNLTEFLHNAGYTKFAQLVQQKNLEEEFRNSPTGLTLLVPQDSAFHDYYTVNSESQRTAVLRYHAIPAYMPASSLTVNSGPISTFATPQGVPTASLGDADAYTINSITQDEDDNVSVLSGGSSSSSSSSSTLTGTLLDDFPFALHTISSLLKPRAVFSKDGY